ncbi:hypothetical protein [Rhodovibrio sodomensis]|uniref:hypothetical protein n=1 Tax=Rhodovibrio sodomensis TaxID=1088 RepID=UPI001907586D|nr:hypothetical protein [Rhodovibrio sodomensis]
MQAEQRLKPHEPGSACPVTAKSGQAVLSFPAPITWEPETAECFKRLYDSRSEPLARLKELVRGALQATMRSTRCPYCLIQKGRVFDHFLDKASFPEFSIEPTNLVYVCSECNEEKNWSGENAGTDVLFPYFAGLDRNVFLQCRIDVFGDIILPVFYLEFTDCEIDSEMAYRIQRHFDKLNLKDRLETESIEFARNFVTKYRFREGNVDELQIFKEFYEEEIELNRKTYGPNFFLCRLYRALIDHYLGEL